MKEGTVNRRIVVSERPRYAIPTANVFSMTEAPVPKAGDRQVLIRTTWLGLDPYLYGRVKQVSSQATPVQLGQVMVGPTVGRVVVSHNPAFAEGDLVQGFWGWQDYFLSDGSRITKVDPEIPKPSYVLGAFGISGFGAYIAINEYLRVKPGEVLTFGAALGGLGQMIGQIGKMRGAYTIGGAGGPEKCKFAMEELGFDICLDRKAEGFHERCLEEFGRAGVDCYAMAAGGRVFRAALPNFNLNARIAVCGLMSFYGMATLPNGPDMTMAVFNEINLKRLSINGLVTMDWIGTPLHDQFKAQMKEWIISGKIRPVEHVVEGLENAPDMLQGLFEGRNFGKAVVRVAD